MMFADFVGMTVTALMETLTALEEDFSVAYFEDGSILWVTLEECEFIIDEDVVTAYVQED